jgi:phage terminase small subunit
MQHSKNYCGSVNPIQLSKPMKSINPAIAIAHKAVAAVMSSAARRGFTPAATATAAAN